MDAPEYAYVDGSDTDAAVHALTDLAWIMVRRMRGEIPPSPPVTLHVSQVIRLTKVSDKAAEMMALIAKSDARHGVYVQIHMYGWSGAAA